MQNKLSIKNFLAFSLMIYPLWVSGYFLYDRILEFVYEEWLFFFLGFLFFSLINLIFSQLRVRFLTVLVPNIILLYAFFVILHPEFVFNRQNLNASLWTFVIDFGSVLIIYIVSFFAVLFGQVVSWIPFLIFFTFRNRNNLGDIEVN